MQTTESHNYSYVFEFERNFDIYSFREWMTVNWHTVFYYIGFYMLFVFGGQAYMQTRERFELRRTLATWNILLAVFSVVGACRTLPEFIFGLRKFGFRHSVCNPSFTDYSKVTGFWSLMFILSKVPELGDTVFIVLRKQKLIFLHWYHHITVLLYCWYVSKDQNSMVRWFVCMNYCVHSIMYTYYALRALRIRVPRSVAMFITSSQILQMVVGCYVSIFAYQIRKRGEPCAHQTEDIVKLTLLMYFSYFVLFAHLFYKSYFNPKVHGKSVKED